MASVVSLLANDMGYRIVNMYRLASRWQLESVVSSLAYTLVNHMPTRKSQILSVE